jgi:hypothetical protein
LSLPLSLSPKQSDVSVCPIVERPRYEAGSTTYISKNVSECASKLKKLTAVLLFCLCMMAKARAGATLLVGEPYGYDGALAGTGHASVYLSNICASSPVVLRLCKHGETGIVISRYHRVAGYDWIAIPLIPYLYSVEKQEDVPLFADKKTVAFLRDRYRREHLETLIPDLPDGQTPGGDWYELVGASYLRTIYAFEIETSPEQDAALVRKLNSRPNHDHFNLVTSNCADFARGIIDFYHPHAVHRSIIGDLGVTTPKQLAKTLAKYSRRQAELESSSFLIPQVPGTIARSKQVRGVLECALSAKKYMVPLLILHPYIVGGVIAGYVGHGHYDPSKNALILNANHELDLAPTRTDRRVFQDQLDELVQSTPSVDSAADDRQWASMNATAEPAIDAAGLPTLQVRVGEEVTAVGITRSNILGVPDGYEFAAGVVKARLREELKSGSARKTSRADVESDLALLRRLLALQPNRLASTNDIPASAQSAAPPIP